MSIPHNANQPQDEGKPKRFNLKKITSQYNVVSSRRGTEKVIVNPTGSSRSNVAGAALFYRLATQAKLDHDRISFSYAADEESGVVAVYVVDARAPGANGIRQSEKKEISFHLGGTFQEYPKLRPVTKVECLLHEDEDQDGEPCAIITLAGGLPKRTGSRGNNNSNNQQNAKSTEAKKQPDQPQQKPDAPDSPAK